VDNLFVIALIFTYFGVAAKYQHRVLYWGILGALIMRGVMIGGGAILIARFHWILYVFGAFLIVTAGKMLFSSAEPDPQRNFAVRLARRFFPITPEFHEQHFLVKSAGRYMLTPMALTLMVVETTDVVFAVDSIPAIFAITGDPFLVFTSNVFAILGLRALYFALAAVLDKFHYLKLSLVVILALVGTKMLLADWLKHILGPNMSLYLLSIIALILGIGVVASILRAKRLAPLQQPAGDDNPSNASEPECTVSAHREARG
jgi:tellurite resistance protein TerC